MKLLMIDNYDSFTYNIVQYFGELGAEVEVFRNDEITLEGIAGRRPDRLCAPRRLTMHFSETMPWIACFQPPRISNVMPSESRPDSCN